MAYLSKDNVENLYNLFKDYENKSKKSYVAIIEEIAEKDYSLNIPFYIEKYDLGEIEVPLKNVISDVKKSSKNINNSTKELFKVLKGVIKWKING